MLEIKRMSRASKAIILVSRESNIGGGILGYAKEQGELVKKVRRFDSKLLNSIKEFFLETNWIDQKFQISRAMLKCGDYGCHFLTISQNSNCFQTGQSTRLLWKLIYGLY